MQANDKYIDHQCLLLWQIHILHQICRPRAAQERGEICGKVFQVDILGRRGGGTCRHLSGAPALSCSCLVALLPPKNWKIYADFFAEVCGEIWRKTKGDLHLPRRHLSDAQAPP